MCCTIILNIFIIAISGNAAVLIVLALILHLELDSFLMRLLRVATFIFVLWMCCLYLSVWSSVMPRYLGWGVFSRSVLLHFTLYILFASLFLRWNALTWVCMQIVGYVVLCEFAQRFFNSCFHFYKRELLSCNTQIVCVYEVTCFVVERLIVSVDVEKDGVGVEHFPVASRSSVFSICYAHCSVPHRTSYWTACSGLLYIVDCLMLCCRVSVLGFYGSLSRKQQIG